MTEIGASCQEHGRDGGYWSVPISWRDLPDIRRWCEDNCFGDYMVNLGRSVLFEVREDAALAMVTWYAAED